VLRAVGSAAVAFGLSFCLLMGGEWLLHRFTGSHDRRYRPGVWLFSLLMAGYFLVTNIGQ
jgi:uncharacterized membrane protein